jgi:hypothetical protein
MHWIHSSKKEDTQAKNLEFTRAKKETLKQQRRHSSQQLKQKH